MTSHSMRHLMILVEEAMIIPETSSAKIVVGGKPPRWDPDLRRWVEEDQPQTQVGEVNGVLRPLYNSENGLIAETPHEQAEFWRWFGKSKAVDQHGRPLVVHRGDKIGKTEFTGRENPSNLIQGNIFFSSDRSVAKGYAQNRPSHLTAKEMNASHGLYSAYLKIEKPVVVDAKGEDWSRIPLSGRLKTALGSSAIQIDDLALYVQQHTKSDGLIAKNVWDQYGDGHQFVVFSNHQIKLV